MARDLACYAAKALQGHWGEVAVSRGRPGGRAGGHLGPVSALAGFACSMRF